MIVLTLLAALQVAGPVGSPIPVSPAITDDGFYITTYDHAVAWTPSGDLYLSLYNDAFNHRLQAVLINAATGAAAAPIQVSSAFATSPDLAWSAARQRFLVVFIDGAYNSPTKVSALVVDANGAPVGGSTPFSLNPDETTWSQYSLEVRVASDGDGWLVTWMRYNFDDYTVRGRLIGGASTNSAPVLASPAFEIQPSAGYVDQVDVAYAAGTYLVAWNNNGVEGRTVSPAGALGAMLSYGPDFDMPRVIAGPGEFVVAAVQTIYGTDGDPALLRVDATGAPIGTAVDLDPDPSRVVLSGTVAVVWNAAASQYLASWLEEGANGCDVKALRLNPDLSPISSSFTIADSVWTGTQWYARIMSASRATGTQVLIQWDAESGSAEGPLQAQRIELGAHPGTPILAAPGQFQTGSILPIPAGGESRWAGFSARTGISNAAGDAVQLQVEVREVGVAFSGTATATGLLVASGITATLDLELAAGRSYHWQARGVTAKGLTSAWVPFGSAPDVASEIDVVVPATATAYVPPPEGSSAEKKVCSASAPGMAAPIAILVGLQLAALLLRFRAAR